MSSHTTCSVYSCISCQKSFSSKFNLYRHQKSCFEVPQHFPCTYCCVVCTREDNLQNHVKVYHPETISCSKCGMKSVSFSNLRKHKQDCQSSLFRCNKCEKQFTTLNFLKWHVRRRHPTPIVCSECAFSCSSKQKLAYHRRHTHKARRGGVRSTARGVLSGRGRVSRRTTARAATAGPSVTPGPSPAPGPSNRGGPRDIPSNACDARQAFGGEAKSFEYVPNDDIGEGSDPLMYLASLQMRIIDEVWREIVEKHSVKWGLCLQVQFSKMSEDGQAKLVEPYFHTKMVVAMQSDSLIQQYHEHVNTLLRRIDEYEGEGSNLNLEKVLGVKLTVTRYRPFRGSTYIELPNPLKRYKKSILNIVNTDDRCLLYSVIAHLYPAPPSSHREREIHYLPHVDRFNVNDISFPATLKDVSKFENQNDVSINVFGYQEAEVDKQGNVTTYAHLYPVQISDSQDRVPSERCIDVLLLSEIDKKHFCLITNLANVVKPANTNRIYRVCRRCLWSFTNESAFEKHASYCHKNIQRIALPIKGEDDLLEFGLRQKSLEQECDFIFYADFESVLEPCNDDTRPNRLQTHVPCGYAYKLVSRIPEYTQPLRVYTGPDACAHFMDSILEVYDWIQDEIYANPVDAIVTDEVRDALENGGPCWLCGEAIVEAGDAVIEHDHISGIVRGVAHSICNLNYWQRKRVVCILHNGERYDFHLLFEAVESFSDRELKCIAHNTENYLTFSVDNLVFMDSYKFLGSSLDTLSKNLKDKGIEHFHHLKEQFPQHVDLLTRKLPFCYEHLTDIGVLDEQALPSKDKFYSSLSEQDISDIDYEFVQRLWKTFHLKSMRDFVELYVSVDTLLLCDVMQMFRSMCMSDYGLEPFNFVSLPGFANMSCLKLTEAQIELLTDPDLYGFFEKGIRGGCSFISHRYFKSNNPYMGDEYDPTKDTGYLLYYDVNSLYATCMTEPLPVGEFEFLERDVFELIDWMNVPYDGYYGYAIELDLTIPPRLHDFFAAFPLAPAHEDMSSDQFSPYCVDMLKELGLPTDKSSGKKLFCTLSDKHNYVVHYETLKCYLRLGAQVKHIHAVVRFTQDSWMRPYIEVNTRKRKAATDNASKDFYKLLSNACYGKQIENCRKYKDIRLVTEPNALAKCTAKCNFKRLNIFSEHLTSVEMSRTSVLLNKPIAFGFSILEHAKRRIFSFWYDELVKLYGDQVKLCMSDTDSLLFALSAPPTIPLLDPYIIMYQNIEKYDTSNFPVAHFLYSEERRKQPGLMKSETGHHIILEFVGLKSKCYSFVVKQESKDKKGETKVNLLEEKRAKGIQKTWVKKHMRHEMLKQCLFENKQFWATFQQIRSSHNTLHTVKVRKVALTPLDNKRYILEDGVTSLPYGYIHPE